MTRPTPASLFDDDSDQNFPLVKILAHRKPATKAERSFQQLVGKIERKREELQQWQAYELRYNQRLVAEIEPLRAQLHKNQRQMAELIDELLSQPATGRRLERVQRAKLSQLLMELVVNLLEDGDDEALEALHDKYSDVSRDEVRRSEMELAQSMLNDVFGIDVGDDHHASNTDELLQHAQRKLEERDAADERRADERRGAREAGNAGANTKGDAAQARREQAAKEVSQSLRDIYRKLASALHPDREQDADARQRKTLMMQRVNQAHDANDLLTLLGLQLEIEQIDAAHLSSVTPQRLAHYNKILREQLAGLESELARHVEPFRHSTGLIRSPTLTPAAVDQHLSASVAQLRIAIRELRQELVAFRNPVLLRHRLEHYELDADIDDPRDLDDLLQRFQDFAPARRGKTRRRG